MLFEAARKRLRKSSLLAEWLCHLVLHQNRKPVVGDFKDNFDTVEKHTSSDPCELQVRSYLCLPHPSHHKVSLSDVDLR